MFVPLLEAPGSPDETSLVVAVHGNRVELSDREPDGPGIFLGTLGGRHCWAIDVDGDGVADATVEFVDLRMLWGAGRRGDMGRRRARGAARRMAAHAPVLRALRCADRRRSR